MARAAPQEDWPRTVAEFEAWHARQPERWEFIDGWPRLMAPASMTHSIIKSNGSPSSALATACSPGRRPANRDRRDLRDSGCRRHLRPSTSRRRSSPSPSSSSRSCRRRARPTTRAANGSPTRRSRASSTTWCWRRTAARPDPQPRRRPLARALRQRRHDRARRAAPLASTSPPSTPSRAGCVDFADRSSAIQQARAAPRSACPISEISERRLSLLSRRTAAPIDLNAASAEPSVIVERDARHASDAPRRSRQMALLPKNSVPSPASHLVLGS